jgi:hypothetical protein
MEIIKELDSFDAKRNTALTFIIPPNYEYLKDYEKIKKRHTAIKSSKRRGKLLCVTHRIDEELGDMKKISGNGLIICCGLDKSSKPILYRINSQIYLKGFEYYYGYKFATNQIKELLFTTTISRLSPENEAIVLKKLSDGLENRLTVVNSEIQLAIDNNLLSHVYYFSHDSIPYRLIELSIEKRFSITMMNMDNVSNRDFSKKFGCQFGYLYYPVDIQFISNYNKHKN